MAKHGDLIYDVGFHRGEDTAFYLKKGFRVVAFEAHPRLAEKGRAMFADAALAGRFTMVEGAVISAEDWTAGKREVTFYINDVMTAVGSIDESLVNRFAKRGDTTRRVSVAAVDFVGCLRTLGVPHFMKIDIEGSDHFCLESLRHVAERPDFLSWELERIDISRAHSELELLVSLGYCAFQIVQQSQVPRQKVPSPSREGNDCEHRFQPGSSGLFGAELPANRWMDRAATAAAYDRNFALVRTCGERSLLGRVPGMGRVLWNIEKCTGLPLIGWQDTHARLGPA
jgi:FkbM family methyltransferase